MTVNNLDNIDKFVHLHVHTDYSLLDGACSISKLIKRAKELEFTSLAITDHNHLGGTFSFQKECLSNNIKPILGYEGYMTHDTKLCSLSAEHRNALALFDFLYDNNNNINNSIDIDKIDNKIENIREDIDILYEKYYIEKEDKEVVYTKKKDKYKALREKKAYEKIKFTPDGKKIGIITSRYTGKEIGEIKRLYKDLFKQYEYDNRQYHIIFLATNQIGWNNLLKLQSISADTCTFNSRFLCDIDLIKQYSEGIICTTACIGSLPAHYINSNQEDKAEELILKLRDIFQNRFYLEIQPLDITEQHRVNLKYIEWSKKHNIKLIATTDVHYILKEDHDDHDTLMCVGTKKLKSDIDRMRYSNDYWLKSYEEMIETFNVQADSIERDTNNRVSKKEYINSCIEAMHNTISIADRIESDIKIGSAKPLFPNFIVPDGISAESYLTIEAYKGLYKYYKENPNIDINVYEYKLATELKVINDKGFAPYFLCVQEYANWADNNDVTVGPGRGSAAGSLVCFCIGITKNIDPIAYDLLFERFLTPDRTAPPDIDLDFRDDTRYKVITHLEDYYGLSKVCHIGTYNQLGVKSGLKDFGRALGYLPSETNAISKVLDTMVKAVPPQPTFNDYDILKDSSKESDKTLWKAFNELENKYKELFRIARKFEKNKRSFGVHASAVLATPIDIIDLVPTRKDLDSNTTVCLYVGEEVEACNLIKLDILGLKSLRIINNTLSHINMSIDDLYKRVDVNDPKIYKLIREQNADGIFQIESDLFKPVIKSMKPDNINDISALVAICRPGPLGAGTDKDYAEYKVNPDKIVPMLPNIEEIMEETYGTLVYQEQFMKICIKCAGFNLGQSDSIARKIVA